MRQIPAPAALLSDPRITTLLDRGMYEVLIFLTAAGGTLLLAIVAVAAYVVFTRLDARPQALGKRWRRELGALRRRLDQLEGRGGEGAALEDRVAFLESLLEGRRGALPGPEETVPGEQSAPREAKPR